VRLVGDWMIDATDRRSCFYPSKLIDHEHLVKPALNQRSVLHQTPK
jgi:hypothetical protein